MRPIIIFLRFITAFQMCRCQLFDVVLSDEERQTIIIGYSTPDDKKTSHHSNENFNNFNSNQNPPLNLRITSSKAKQMSDRNSRKEIDFDTDFIQSVPNTEDGLVNGSEAQSKSQEITIETTPELSLEKMFDYTPKTKANKKTGTVRDMESYLNLTSDLKLRSYDDVVKSNGFDLEALLNHTFNDGISENIAKHSIKTNVYDPKYKKVQRKNTNKDEVYDMVAREQDDVGFSSDFDSEAESKTLNRNFRRNLYKEMYLKPKFILLENNNGQPRYSMITNASDLINSKPSKIILTQPTHITSKNIIIDEEMRNFHDNMRVATNSTFAGVPMKLLLSLLGSNGKQASATEEENKPFSSPKINDSVIKFIKASARNIGDIVYGRG